MHRGDVSGGTTTPSIEKHSNICLHERLGALARGDLGSFTHESDYVLRSTLYVIVGNPGWRV